MQIIVSRVRKFGGVSQVWLHAVHGGGEVGETGDHGGDEADVDQPQQYVLKLGINKKRYQKLLRNNMLSNVRVGTSFCVYMYYNLITLL